MTHSRSTRPHRRLLIALLGACTLLAPRDARAHAVVYPRIAAPGAYEKYVLRVPNEKNVATTRVEIRFPAGLVVVSFGDVASWDLRVLTDSAGAVVGAEWTGTLPPQRFVELPFVAVNPKRETTLVWPAFQTYADGERVGWTGAPDSRTPASVTTVAASAGEAGGGRTSDYLAGAALLLALVSTGLALRKPEPARA